MSTVLINFLGQPGCVDKDTEYFNGSEWKSISEYTEGEQVLTYNSSGIVSLELPQAYIKEPCDNMWHLYNSTRSLDQVLSDEHRIIYKSNKDDICEKTTLQLIEHFKNNPNGLNGRIISSFNTINEDSKYSKDLLRLLIAVSADGSYVKNTKQWRIRIVKERKINRLRELIKNVGLELDERIYKDGYHNFYVPEEYGTKEFPMDFYWLSEELRQVFKEEIFLWDGYKQSYYTTIKHNADVAQFILSQFGYRVSIFKDEREESNRKRSLCYQVRLTTKKSIYLRRSTTGGQGGFIKIEPCNTVDGYKYCFTVSTGMLVLRRNSNIFVTGNSGKSTLGTQLVTELKMRDYDVEFVSEFVKTWTYTGRKVNKFGQYFIFGNETENQSRLFSKVDFVIADSPVLLTSFYQQFYWGSSTLVEPAKEFYKFAEEEGVKVVNIFIDRKFKYNPKGRFQTEEESGEVHKQLLWFLKENNYKYLHLKVPVRDRIKTILDYLGITKDPTIVED